MKLKILAILLFTTTNLFGQVTKKNFVYSDIQNFWNAYDKIKTTKDSAQQYNYLNSLFLAKGTEGLKAIMEVRNYNAKSYIDAINNYPKFWNSVRNNTLQAKDVSKKIEKNIIKFGKLYPQTKPAKIYFTIGALRTNGTTLSDKILIGSELAFADEQTETSEFPNYFSHLPNYFKSNPIKNIVFLNVHEYIHTQQKTTIGKNLLEQCIIEGVAEFLAELSTKQNSTAPAISYGKQNNQKVREVFEKQMFNKNNGFWLYSSAENEFQTRDLGYYIGYAICESFYKRFDNKKQAIKEMIELDYENPKSVSAFVDKSKYFSNSFDELKNNYEQSQPKVLGIKEFENGNKNVDSNLQQFTILFSQPMNKNYRSFEFGPLGEKNVLKISKVIGFSEDGKSLTLETKLEPNKVYQLLVNDGFRNLSGTSLKPYLIDIKTTK